MGVLKEIKESQTKNVRKIIYIVLIFLIPILIYSYITFINKKQEIVNVYEKAHYGDIKTSFLADGKIVGNNQLNLSFSTTGKIKNIYKNIKEQVKVGDKIAQIDDKYLQLDVEKKGINLQTSYANLDAKKKLLSLENINSAKKDLDYKKSLIENTKIELENQKILSTKTFENSLKKLQSIKSQSEINKKDLDDNIKSLEISLTNTKVQLDLEKSNSDLILKDENSKIVNINQNIIEKITYINTYSEKYLIKIDEFLGITDSKKNLNDSYEIYIGAKNTSYKNEAITQFGEVNNLFNSNKEIFLQDLNNFEDFNKKMQDLLNKTILVIDNSISSNSFSQDTINNLKEEFQGYLQTFKQNYQTYLTLKQSLESEQISKDIKLEQQKNLITNLEGSLNLLQHQFDTATYNYNFQINQINKDTWLAQDNYNLEKLNYEKSLVELENKISLLQKEYSLSKAKYDEIVSIPTNTQLEPYNKAIEIAQKDLEISKKLLDDTFLISQVDGVIYDIGFKAGENLNQTNNYVKVNTKNNFYIESLVEELNISKVYLGQNVELSLDSIDNYTMTGIVSFISDKSQLDEKGVIEYKVIIDFVDNKGQIKDGMSISVDFITNDLKNVLLIPKKAIKIDLEKNYVITKIQEKKYIKIGISNGVETQVLEGLNDKEEVLIP